MDEKDEKYSLIKKTKNTKTESKLKNKETFKHLRLTHPSTHTHM